MVAGEPAAQFPLNGREGYLGSVLERVAKDLDQELTKGIHR